MPNFKKLLRKSCGIGYASCPEESLFNDRSPSDGEELIAICQAGGWQYLCKRGMFGIFVAADETVPELETERRPLYKRNIIFLLYILLASVLLWLWPVADYGRFAKTIGSWLYFVAAFGIFNPCIVQRCHSNWHAGYFFEHADTNSGLDNLCQWSYGYLEYGGQSGSDSCHIAFVVHLICNLLFCCRSAAEFFKTAASKTAGI